MSALTTAVLAPIFIGALLALSQAVPLRAGSFSFTTAGTAAIGGYMSAYLIVSQGWSPITAAVVAIAAATVVSCALAYSIRKLRDVFAAIASIAFVEVVQTIAANWTSITGGPSGISSIPIELDTLKLLILLVCVVACLILLNRTRLARSFDAVRQDEAAAASLGISISATQFKAVVIGGAIGGMAGVAIAYNSSAIFPGTYGFTLLLQVVTYTYLGGFRSWRGPIIGAAIVTLIPQLFSSLGAATNIIYGGILIAIIILLPKGIIDTLEQRLLFHDSGQRRGIGTRKMQKGRPKNGRTEAISTDDAQYIEAESISMQRGDE